MNKKAIVTGASRGIGKGIAMCLGKAGYDIVFSYKTKKEEADLVRKSLLEFGVKAEYFQADLEVPGESDKLFQKAVDVLQGLDLLVNNAGITIFHPIQDLKEEDMMKMLQLDFLSYLWMSHLASQYMIRHGVKGNIISITSSRSQRAYPEDSVYGGIKAGINRASQSMALDLAPYGIRVNCVAPGAVCIRTPEEIRRENREDLEGFWEKLGKRIPMGRNGTPEDIGNAVVYLASNEADYITGEVLRVDGGLILPGMPEKE